MGAAAHVGVLDTISIIAAKAIKIAILPQRPLVLLRAFIIPSTVCSRTICCGADWLRKHACAKKSVGCVIRSVYNRLVLSGVLSGVLSVSHELTPLPRLPGQEGFTHNSSIDHNRPGLGL